MRSAASHAALQLGRGYSQLCYHRQALAPSQRRGHRAVGSEYKAVFLIWEVVTTNEQGFGRTGEVADVKGGPSLKGLHNL